MIEKYKRKIPWEELEINGGTILKRNLNIWCGSLWTGFIWPRTETDGGLLKTVMKLRFL
jgi:hypothetical protein